MVSPEQSHRSASRGPPVPLTDVQPLHLDGLITVSSPVHSGLSRPRDGLCSSTSAREPHGSLDVEVCGAHAHLPFAHQFPDFHPTPPNLPAWAVLISVLVSVSPHPSSFGLDVWHIFLPQPCFFVPSPYCFMLPQEAWGHSRPVRPQGRWRYCLPPSQ